MKFDIIILSYSKTDKHRKITEDCIKSLREAKNDIGVNIIVLESFDEHVSFDGAKTMFYKTPSFNYNNSMNEGFKHTTSDYVFFCNNDLIFYDGWADNCYYAFQMGYKSLSPRCPTSHSRFVNEGDYVISGYQIGYHIPGWCIGVEREMFKSIGGFNEAVAFWYSDNIYGEQLQVNKIKHALVCSSKVRHLDFGSKTLMSLTPLERKKLTSAQKNKFDKEKKRLWYAKR